MTDAAPAPAAPAPVSNDQAIGQLARDFLSDVDRSADTAELDPNNPQAREDPPQATEDPENPEAETPTPETPEVPMVEVDVDGEKYLVPEKVKHRVMADKDYRQKTMEVSATKKQLEQLIATATQTSQQAQQLAPYHAQLSMMDSQIQYLDQQLRSGALNSDPLEYNRVQGELAVRLHQRGHLAAGLHQQVEHLTTQQQQLRANQLALDAPKLFEQFPEISKPETQQKLMKYIVDEGLPPEAIDFLNYSAAGTKLAWKAHQYDQMVKDQQASKAKLRETVKTLPGATQSSRAVDKSAKDKQLQQKWQDGGGKINDPAFTQLLRSKLRG